ncbi:MAG: hypothetical protein JNL32_06075 [Candidatus Kapabacteria bacterium]|nr:hypothetical protein [Candidatus Kapabacteria bacterium]
MEKPLIILATVVVSILAIIIFNLIRSSIERRKTIKKLRSLEWSREHKKINTSVYSSLPLPVRRYLQHVIRDGSEQIRFATIKQRGRFRSLSQPTWGALRAESNYTGTIPGMVWHAMISVSALMKTSAQLLYNDGVGSGYVKYMGVFTLFDPKGKEVSFALLARILMETVWFPTSLVPGGLLRWEPINDSSSKAILTNKGKSISAVFHFNEAGEVERVVTRDKYRDAETSYEREQCTMHCSAYKDFLGIKIPTHIRLEWNLEEQDFDYAEITVTDAIFE